MREGSAVPCPRAVASDHGARDVPGGTHGQGEATGPPRRMLSGFKCKRGVVVSIVAWLRIKQHLN